jgi:hypothetical protein
MGFPTVHLDDQTPCRPEEVNDEFPHSDVHIRLGKAVAATDAEQARLQL